MSYEIPVGFAKKSLSYFLDGLEMPYIMSQTY